MALLPWSYLNKILPQLKTKHLYFGPQGLQQASSDPE